MNYQRFILAGNASTDAQMRRSKNGGIPFASFGVGVSDSKKRMSYFPVVVFGKQGEALAKFVTKGRQVLVEGRIEANSGRFSVVADRVELGALLQPSKPVEKAEEAK